MKTIILFSILLFSASGTFAQNVAELWAGNGTGIVIDSKGMIATNYHVVKDALEIEVDFGKGDSKRSYKCEVLVTDKKNDLAILRINDRRFSGFGVLPYTFKTSIARVGESVFALGYPKALSILGTEIKYTRGDISALSGAEGDPTTYTLSLSIQPGNSGGPLFDFSGNLVGITNAKIVSPDVDNVSYAIKSLYLKSFIDLSSYKITLPTGSSLVGKPITEQIEILSDYVALIKVRLPDTRTKHDDSSPLDEMVSACGYAFSKVISNKWLQLGGVNGSLGCLISSEKKAETSSSGITGSYVVFEGNRLFTSNIVVIYRHKTGRYAGQSFVLYSGIYFLYRDLGGSSSWLGFPIGDEYNDPGGRRCNFEGGYIFWNSRTGVSQAFKRETAEDRTKSEASGSSKLIGTWETTEYVDRLNPQKIINTFSDNDILDAIYQKRSSVTTARLNWIYTAKTSTTGMYELFMAGEMVFRGGVRWIDQNAYEETILFSNDPSLIGMKKIYRRLKQ